MHLLGRWLPRATLLAPALLLAACAPAGMSFEPDHIECGKTEQLAVDVTLPPEWTRGTLVAIEPDGVKTEREISADDLERVGEDRYRYVIDDLSGCRPGTYEIELRYPGGGVIEHATFEASEG